MEIDSEKCIGCARCLDYCTMRGSVMHPERDKKNPGRIYYVIEDDECVECSVCLRSGCCPVDALSQADLQWPRIVRKNFSDPLKIHPETRVPGRGTEEMKTNEITGRYGRGKLGMAFELGRPGMGSRLYDVEKVAKALSSLGVVFEEKNPVTKLMIDRKKGLINPEVLNEKVLSAIIEFMIPVEKFPQVLRVAEEASARCSTVFSGDVICRPEPDGSIPSIIMAKKADSYISINGKSNLGLGKPLWKE